MNYKFHRDDWGSNFSVPTAVVTDFISVAEENYIKVLLCVLSGRNCTSTEIISKASGVSESKVDEAVRFWINSGIISNENTPSVKPIALPVSAVEAVKPSSAERTGISVRYSSKEILEKAENDKNLKMLLNDIQKLQFSVNNSELGKLIELYEFYHFDVPSILLVADYCSSLGKRSVAYLYKVMRNWYGEDIFSYKQIEEKIIRQTEMHKYETQVLKIFGMTNSPSTKQKAYLERWNKLGINLELIKIAYDKCMDNKTKLSFSYIDGIVKKWAENGVSSVEQADIMDAKFKSKRAFPKPKDAKKNSYDLDKFSEYALDFSLYGDKNDGNDNK